MKNIKIFRSGVALAILLTMLSLQAFSQSPSKPNAQFVYDAVDVIAKKELKEGLNPIMKSSSGNMELNLKAKAGKKPEYVILLNGKPIKTDLVKTTDTVARAKKTTCWECGKDAQGNTHCWKIPCPVIVGPWLPTSSSARLKIQQ